MSLLLSTAPFHEQVQGSAGAPMKYAVSVQTAPFTPGGPA